MITSFFPLVSSLSTILTFGANDLFSTVLPSPNPPPLVVLNDAIYTDLQITAQPNHHQQQQDIKNQQFSL
jgi:hypothetical protein